MKELKIEGHKLWYHSERVNEWIKTGDATPIYVEVGLNNNCNHDCIFCGADWRKGNYTLQTPILLKNLENMAQFGVKSICYSGFGEPVLHKDFSEIINFTKKQEIDVAFSTNVVLYNKKKAEETLSDLTWVRFSISGATSNTYAKIHKPKRKNPEKDFAIAIKNLEDSVEIKRKNNYDVTLGVQFLLLEENVSEAIKMAQLCKEIGVDNLQIKPYSYNPHSHKQLKINYSKYFSLEKELDSFSDENFKVKYRAKRIKRETFGKNYPICYGEPFFTTINEKGSVQPCIHYYETEEYSYGNINKESFSSIWKSPKRKQVIKMIEARGLKGCKKGCRLDEINSDLYDLKKGKISLKDVKQSGDQILHVNFI